jgi:hypothetical protein
MRLSWNIFFHDFASSRPVLLLCSCLSSLGCTKFMASFPSISFCKRVAMKWRFPTREPPPESPQRRLQNQEFVPKPSRLSTKYLHKTPDDQDVWVEGRYRSATGGDIPYFRSVRTGVCCKMEPPTGAHRCVRYGDENDLQSMAVQATGIPRNLSKDDIRSLPEPTCNSRIVGMAVRAQKKESRWRRRWTSRPQV